VQKADWARSLTALSTNYTLQCTNPLVGSEMSTLHRESRRRRVHSAGERVVLAIAIATPGGIGSLTIRLLAQHLGVKPMAIELAS
jgi:hypothetical protein